MLDSKKIAAIRTVAPLIWGALLSALLDVGVDLQARIAELTGVPAPVVEPFAYGLITMIIWGLAQVGPWSWIRTLLLFFDVDSTTYRVDDYYVTSSGRRVPVRDIVDVSESPSPDTDFVQAHVDAIKRRHIDTDTLAAAAAQLVDPGH